MESATPLAGEPTRLGPYTLLRVLGRGAMGIVYEARHERLDRLVALKVVAAGALASADELRRFRTEARAASRLRHPSIVPIHDVGEDGGHHYLVMDLVRGPSLADRLRDGPIEPAEAARIVRSVAEALHFAHERGVVHRDVKPANILLDEDGRPLLTDFGLARTADEESSLTVHGAPLGTPAYMAPEQAEGRSDRVSPRTDVHALGAVLYALLTGRSPFAAPTAVATLQRVRQDDPIPPRVLDPSLPADLCTVAMAALRKDPARRYASAGAMAEDLERFERGQPIVARPVGRLERLALAARRHPRVAALVAAFVVVAAGGAAAVVWQWRAAEDALLRAARAKEERLRQQVAALKTVESRAFLGHLEALLGDPDPLVDPLLAELARAEEPRPRFRARLAQIARRPEELKHEDASLFDRAPDPFERQLAIAVVRGAVARGPSDAAKPLLDSIARRVAERNGDGARRARTLALAFAFDVGEPERSPDVGLLAAALVDEDPYALAAHASLLEPMPAALRDALLALVESADGARRRQATSLVCRSFAVDALPIVSVVGSLEPESLALVAAALRERPESGAMNQALRELLDVEAALASAVERPASAPPLELPPDVNGAIGAFAAYALRVPAKDLAPLLQRMADHGYRPVRLRPRLLGDTPHSLVGWTRDGAAFDWIAGATREELAALERSRPRTLVPVDVASVTSEGETRFTAVFGPKPEGLVDAVILAGATPEEYPEAEQKLVRRAFAPVRFHLDVSDPGGMRFSFVFGLFDVFVHHAHENFTLVEGGAAPVPGFTPVDATLRRATEEGFVVSAVFAPEGHDETRVVAAADDEEFHARAAPLLRDGFTLQSLSSREDDGARGIVGVWTRPGAGPEERVAADRRAAEAAALLAHLGDLEPALALLDDLAHPGARARLSILLPATSYDPARLVAALDPARPTSTKALLVALGRYPAHALEPRTAEDLRSAGQDLAAHPDSGVASAALWCLAAHGLPPDGTEARGGAEAPNGHRFLTVRPTAPFLVGSTRADPDYDAGEEPHLERVDRIYALSDAETTFAQYGRFLAEHPEFDEGVRGPDDHPAERVSWLQAAAYCRWLSERAGLPADEMCFPPLDRMKAIWTREAPFSELELPADLLSRRGFRLPTEAEWEFACRAGTTTPRPFGRDDRLLGAFTTCRDTGGARRPVRTAPPNDLGFFDLLGSVFEWCQGARYPYPVGGEARLDRLLPPDVDAHVVRGGSYDMPSYRLRSAERLSTPPLRTGVGLGFRVARTL